MVRTVLFWLVCVGGASASPTPERVEQGVMAPDPAVGAHMAQLIGGNCTQTTGLVAKQVLDDGRPWAFTGRLVPTENDLHSEVAAPFAVGPNGVNVIANEVLEELLRFDLADDRLALEGRVLGVDGVQYFVVTDFRQSNS